MATKQSTKKPTKKPAKPTAKKLVGKKPVAKKSVAKPAAKAAKPSAAPFAFLGQGEASYYEWFEMWIWFASPVPKAQQQALLKRAPALCKRDAQWPNASLLWASTGDQWIQQHLIEAYGTKAAKAKYKKAVALTQTRGDDEDFLDDDRLDDLLASGGEEKAFNADIEQWLRTMHASNPILFAARREDGEAGGTRLGPWHKASIKLFHEHAVPVLQALVKKATLKPTDLRRAPIEIAIDFVGAKTVPPSVRKLQSRD